MDPASVARAVPGAIAKEKAATMAITTTANVWRSDLLTTTTSIQIAMAASMHPRRREAQHRSASQIRHSQASAARLGKCGRVLVGKGRRILRVIAIGNYGVEPVRAISYLNRNVARGRVIGDVVLHVILGAIGDDLRDGVVVLFGLVVINTEGHAAIGVVRLRLEYPAFAILKFKRELPRLEGATFKYLPSPDCRGSL